MKTFLMGLFSRDGKTISNGCVLTWITFLLCIIYWVKGLYVPDTKLPESLQEIFEVCLLYMLGGTVLFSSRNIGCKYLDRKYSGKEEGKEEQTKE